MSDGLVKLNGQLSLHLAQNGAGLYNDGKLVFVIPLETAKNLSKELASQLKLYGVA